MTRYFGNIASGAVLAALAAMPIGAFAADLPVYTKAPPVAPAFSWTGFYVGGTAGAAWTNADVDLNTVNGANALYDPLDIPTLNAFGSPNLSQTNAIYGLKAGYNYQQGMWVVGVEGDISSFRFNQAVANSGNPFVTFPTRGSAQMTTSVSTSWLSTVRARAGYAADHWLFYGTAGVAIADVRYSNTYVGFSPIGSGFEFESAAASGTQIGWTAGAGLDYAITPHWVLSAEYLHIELGSLSATGLVTTGSNRTANFNFSTKVSSDIARGGIAYKF